MKKKKKRLNTTYVISFALDNDDMRSSKHHVTFLSVIFILQCFSKSILIRCLVNKFFFCSN